MAEAYEFITAVEGVPFELGPFRITPFEMQHIGVLSLGYRIESGGVVLAYTGTRGRARRRSSSRGCRSVPVRGHVPERLEALSVPPVRVAGRRAGVGRGVDHLVLTHLTPSSTTASRSGRRRRRSTASRYRGPGDAPRGRPVSPRPDGRAPGQLRPVAYEVGYQEWAAGSVLFSMGKTRVLCAASVSTEAPRWLRGPEGVGDGRVLDAAGVDHGAVAARGEPRRPGGGPRRSSGIGRPPSRDRPGPAGGADDHVDCDVLQADAGTRTAAIAGGYLALALSPSEGCPRTGSCPPTS